MPPPPDPDAADGWRSLTDAEIAEVVRLRVSGRAAEAAALFGKHDAHNRAVAQARLCILREAAAREAAARRAAEDALIAGVLAVSAVAGGLLVLALAALLFPFGPDGAA